MIKNSEKRICQNCKKGFLIDSEDFNFYEMMKVPPPTWCPDCRLQRRLAWRNERGLHKRLCSLCSENIIAMYSAEVPFPVYCPNCWYSDKWDATEYGRKYDFTRPFFIQFQELANSVPHISLEVTQQENCTYTNQTAYNKNCYLVFSATYDENCSYCERVMKSKEVFDSQKVYKSEQSYECIDCTNDSNISFCNEANDSLDCSFCFDIKSSHDCFMCTNLRYGSSMMRNKHSSKEEIKKERDSLGSYKALQKYKREFTQLKKKAIYKYADIINSINTTGHNVHNARNCRQCFGASDIENCHYCFLLNDAKDSMDINNGCCVMSRSYEVSTTGVKTSDIILSVDIWPDAYDVSYSQSCRNDVKHLFGCVSVRKKKYCILNKEYSKEEYEELVARIKKHMDEMPYIDANGITYKYGEFFPVNLSPFPYNDSMAHEYFPMTKKEYEIRGYIWFEKPKEPLTLAIEADKLPDNINDVDISFSGKIIGCLHKGLCDQRCTSGFRLTNQELQFYKTKKLALPRLCPNCRHYERLKIQNSLKLWKRKCMKGECKNEFETSYAPERPEIVYCEKCYQQEVY